MTEIESCITFTIFWWMEPRGKQNRLHVNVFVSLVMSLSSMFLLRLNCMDKEEYCLDRRACVNDKLLFLSWFSVVR
jgi:hypothetical protein